MTDKSRRVIGRAADVVFICVCLFLTGIVVKNIVSSGSSADDPLAVEGFIPPGEPSPVIQAGDNVTLNKRAVIIVMSSTCHWCGLQLPFYKQIESQIEASRFELRYISAEDEQTFVAYLRKGGLRATLRTDAMMTPRIKGTPTLLVLDQDQNVLQSFQGPLSVAQQKKLLSSLH